MADAPLDVTAIVKLAARARTAIYEFDESTGYSDPRQELQLRAADLAIVAAARLAAHTGAIGLVREIRAWARASPYAEDPSSVVYDLAEALALAVREGLAPEQLEPLLAGPHDWLVAKIALALCPERASDLALLRRLADDPRTKVAAAAHRRLGSRHTWSWCAGIFEHDPIAAHADAPTILDALASARTALGREHASAKPTNARALCAATDRLPPALAIPLLEAGLLVFPSTSAWPDAKIDEGPIARLHALGGVDAVVHALQQVVQAHGDPEQALVRVASWCGLLPEQARVELAVRVLPWVDAEPAPDARDPKAKPRGAARLVAAVWPCSRAPMPLVECLVAGERDMIALMVLKRAIERSTADLEPHADRLLELALAQPRLLSDLPNLFALLASTVGLARLAAMVEIAAGSDHASLRSWALEQRTGRLAPSDPEQRHSLALGWLDDPTVYKTIMGSELGRGRLLPWLRLRLRAGALTLAEANTVMVTIGQLYGGVVEPIRVSFGILPGSELEAAERRAQARAQLGAWVDPPSGPPCSEEWTSVRALARAKLETDRASARGVLAVVPVGPWTSEDLALLDLIERRAVSTDPLGPVMLHHLRSVLDGAPTPDASARAQRVLATWQAPRGAPDPRSPLDLEWLRNLAGGASEPPTTAPTDWMDEEEPET